MMTTEIYFQELQSVMTATRLIYHIAYEEVPNEVATEADRCRLALMGLAPAIRSKLMQDHASTIAKAKASNRPLDPGYTQSGFDSWSLLEQLAKSFKRNQQTGAGLPSNPLWLNLEWACVAAPCKSPARSRSRAACSRWGVTPRPPQRQISRWGVKPSPPPAQDLALGGGPPPAHVSHVLARVPPPAFNGCEA